MYSSEQSFEVFEFPILTNRSRVWPVYTWKQHQFMASHNQWKAIKNINACKQNTDKDRNNNTRRISEKVTVCTAFILKYFLVSSDFYDAVDPGPIGPII